MSGEEHYVSRVNQLDAAALDYELLNALKRNLWNGLEYIQHNWLLSLEPEIIAAVRALIWHYTVNTNGATIGQKLFELQYLGSNGKQLSSIKSYSLSGLWIALPWARARFIQFLPQEKLQIVDSLEVALKMAEVVNFLVFLYQGKYSSLIERILSIRHSHSHPQSIRQVQYEYMNRELLWNGIAEFISFLIPLINLRHIKNALLCMVWPKSLIPSLVEHRTMDDFRNCGICGETPVAPHEIGCRHVFCYYCIMSSVMADARFHCTVCHHQANGCNNVSSVHVM